MHKVIIYVILTNVDNAVSVCLRKSLYATTRFVVFWLHTFDCALQTVEYEHYLI